VQDVEDWAGGDRGRAVIATNVGRARQQCEVRTEQEGALLLEATGQKQGWTEHKRVHGEAVEPVKCS
jgi:hypothetical protein